MSPIIWPPAAGPVAAVGGATVTVVKADGLTTIATGSPTLYTVTIINYGPNAINCAKVRDTVAAAITGVTWSYAVA